MEIKNVILLAEDDESHFILETIALRKAGINDDIIRFSDGNEVLNFFMNSDNFSKENIKYILLMDVKLPKFDGIEIMKKLKSNIEFKNTPFFLISACQTEENIKLFNEYGCSGYITKPMDDSSIKMIQHKLAFA